MKVVLSWLREYCAWDMTEEELAERLTMSGTEVEAVHRTGSDIPGVVAARIVSSQPHPNADRLRVCRVEDGSDRPRQVVCGAKNYQDGDVVPLALPGASLPGGMAIKEARLRGVESQGMLCSGAEIGVEDAADGLLILPPGTRPGTALAELFPGETVFDLEVTPNRADLLSYQGLAREWAALGARLRTLPAPPAMAFDSRPSFPLRVEEKGLCPRYTGCVLEGVRVEPSPAWMQQRLQAAGLRPINNVVDITNYVMLETGQPLHAFDLERLRGGGIVVRLAREGETLHALDGKLYALGGGDWVIADAEAPVALAGVMGGEGSGVGSGTQTVLLESACFDAASVRRTSRRLGLVTDSSYRFERGVDPDAVDRGRDRAVALLTELAGARPRGGAVQSAPAKRTVHKVGLRPRALEALMGRPVAAERVAAILEQLGCERQGARWRVPGWRPDLRREVDLIEEVARIEGLASVPSRLPPGVAEEGPDDRAYDGWLEIRRALRGWGWNECLTLPFASAETTEAGEAADAVRLLNPMNSEHGRLRTSLLETVLPCIRRNLAHGLPGVKIFEAGPVFRQLGGRPVQEAHLLLVGTGLEEQAHWKGPERAVDYFTLRSAAAALAAGFPPLAPPEPRAVEASLLRAHGIKQPVYYVEMPLPRELGQEPVRFRELPQFPAVHRDLAFVVDRAVAHGDLVAALASAGVAELEAVRCFDLFQDDSGERLDAGKKSVAFALTYRSPARTLSETDVARWEQQLVASVARATGAVLRS